MMYTAKWFSLHKYIFFFIFFSIIVYYKTLNTVPCWSVSYIVVRICCCSHPSPRTGIPVWGTQGSWLRGAGRLPWVPLPGWAHQGTHSYKSTVTGCGPECSATCWWWVIAGWVVGGEWRGQWQRSEAGDVPPGPPSAPGRKCILWPPVTSVH